MATPNLITIAEDGSVLTELRCTKCGLCKNPDLKTNFMQGTGCKKPDLMFVGYNPGKEDDGIGKPFTGKNGKMLREMLAEVGIDVDRCYLTNAVKCASYDKKVEKAHWEACQEHLKKEIEKVQPKAIVALGGRAFTFLTGFNRIGKFRRCGFPCVLDPRITVYPVNQPMMVEMSDYADRDRIRAEIVSDLLWLRKKADEGTLDIPDGIRPDYQVAFTVEDVRAFLNEFADVKDVCFDLETCDTNFAPTLTPNTPGAQICMVALSKGPGHGRSIPLWSRGITNYMWWDSEEYQEVFNLLKEFFHGDHSFFGHNVFFDQKWSRHFFDLPRLDISYDTMLAHYIIDPEKGGHRLDELAIQYGKMQPWKPPTLKKLMKDTRNLGIYAAKDVDATFRVRAGLEETLSNKQKWLLYNLLLPLGHEYQELEYRGIGISEENLKKYSNYLDELIKEYREKIQALEVVKKFRLAKNTNFNPASQQQVAYIMEHLLKLPAVKRTDKGGYSTAVSVLEEYLEEPFVKYLYFIRKLDKLKGTYCDNVRLCLDNYQCGRVFTTVKLHGTVTGRPSSSGDEGVGVNLFNQPREDTAKKAGLKDPKIAKAVFVPKSKGRVLLQIDESQAELRTLAMLSKDPNLIQAYRNGIDIHRQTASQAFGVPFDEVTKGQRSQAKAVSFALIYGASETSLQKGFVERMRQQAREEGREFTKQDEIAAVKQGMQFIQGHKEAYPKVWSWIKLQEQQVRKYRYQETPLGRRRYYRRVDNAAIRQASNFPIQCLASDLSLISLLRTNRILRELNLDAELVLTVYDSLIYDVALRDLWQTAKIAKDVMESLSDDFSFINVPLVADVEVGFDLGHMKDFDVETGQIVEKE